MNLKDNFMKSIVKAADMSVENAQGTMSTMFMNEPEMPSTLTEKE